MTQVNRASRAVRSHPFAIAAFLYRFLFLLILPLARGFLYALKGSLIEWLHGAWFDLLIVLLIVLLAVLKWRMFKYHMDCNGIYFTNGILFRREMLIPMSRICTLSTIRPFWFRPFHVTRIRVDTIARDPKKADVELYVKDVEAARLMALRDQPAISRGSFVCEYQPNLLGITFLSLFTSNSFIGILFVSTFISQTGQILGQELSDQLIATFEEISRQIAFGLPPLAAGVAIALMGGWLVAFLYNLLQTKNLRTRRTEDTLQIQGGVVVEKEYSLNLRDISFIDVRQSLFTRVLRLSSVFINAIGFGKDKSDINAIIPFSSNIRTMRWLTLLLPEYEPVKRKLKPNAGAIFKFIIEPLWPCLLIPAAALIVPYFLPNWAGILHFAGFMLSLPAYWFMGVRLMDFASSGVSRKGEYFTLRYSEWYYLHTVVFSYDKISLVNIRQSILQRGDKKCDLVVSSRAEGRFTHHIRNIDWDACVAIFDALEEPEGPPAGTQTGSCG